MEQAFLLPSYRLLFSWPFSR